MATISRSQVLSFAPIGDSVSNARVPCDASRTCTCSCSTPYPVNFSRGLEGSAFGAHSAGYDINSPQAEPGSDFTYQCDKAERARACADSREHPGSAFAGGSNAQLRFSSFADKTACARAASSAGNGPTAATAGGGKRSFANQYGATPAGRSR